MRKIDNLFIGLGLIAAIAVTGTFVFNTKTNTPELHTPNPEIETKYGSFLAAQHAIYVNDYDAATRFADRLRDVQYPAVINIKMMSEFLSGRMPLDAKILKNDKAMPASIIYDAYLIKNNNWKELHNRHKNDDSALTAPLRIWSAIANDWRTNTFNFIDKLPTNNAWKSFVRGQIHAELGNADEARKHFTQVDINFININDYLYMMSFYQHHGFDQEADGLHYEFTRRPGGMFMTDFQNIPDWSVYSGLENALAFSLVQNVSHTQIMMYSDLAILLLRFAQITAPDFAHGTDAINYYMGQYFYNNAGKYQTHFDKIKTDSPFYSFAMLRTAEKSGDIRHLEQILKTNPLFVPAVNKVVAHHIQNGNKRAAMRVVNHAIKQENLDNAGRAFFIKSRAYIHYAFGDLKSAQDDIRTASDSLIVDGEILSLQAKIWAAQNRDIENAYQYAMTLVSKNPSDIIAWDTLGYVVAVREGADAALEVFERVSEVGATCSSLFMHMGDIYAEKGDKNRAMDAYMRAIDLSDDGLVVVPEIERKIRKIK